GGTPGAQKPRRPHLFRRIGLSAISRGMWRAFAGLFCRSSSTARWCSTHGVGNLGANGGTHHQGGLGPPPAPWVTLGWWAAIAFGIPLGVRAVGASLVWAFSGFAAKRP